MAEKDLLSVADLSRRELAALLALAKRMKKGGHGSLLAGMTAALLFEKPSLRTRVSFDVAMAQLGGRGLSLSQAEVGWGSREPLADVARVLSRYVNVLVIRAFSQGDLEVWAEYATVPVINALTDEEHPCQALADLLTIQEKKGRLEGLPIAFVGDGNNVARSLALASSMVGARFRIASPPGYGLPEPVKRRAKSLGPGVESFESPEEAVRGAEVVYTDVWVSMGQEKDRKERLGAFHGFRVGKHLMALARPGAIFMHPLPAHHGEEIEEGMLEHPQSVVFEQAENRLHLQKAVLVHLLDHRGVEG